MSNSAENGWTRKRLVDIASISSGNSISAKDRAGKYSSDNTVGRYFISTKDVGFDGNINHVTDVAIPCEDQSSFKLAPKGSTLVCSEGGSAGRKVGLLKEDVHYGNKLFSVAGGEEVLPEMIHYFCLSDDFVKQFGDRKTGLIGGVSLKKFQTIEMPLPPLKEQQRIVAVLDEAFEGLARARSNAEANLQNARELVATSTDALCSEVSDGWQQGAMGDFCTFEGGFAFKSGDTVKESQVQLIRIGNLYQNVLDLDRNPVFYPNEFADTYKKFRLKAGDIILSLTGTVGKQDYGFAVEVPDTERALLLNQRVARIMPKDVETLSAQFLLRFLRSASFLTKLYSISRGTRQANLSTRDMADLPMSIPSKSRQIEIVERLDAIDGGAAQLVNSYENSIADLEDLRQSLLQKAFAGELT